MSVTLLTEHHLEFVILKGGCTGPSESTIVKMPHCWKSHIVAQIYILAFEWVLWVMSDVALSISFPSEQTQ